MCSVCSFTASAYSSPFTCSVCAIPLPVLVPGCGSPLTVHSQLAMYISVSFHPFTVCYPSPCSCPSMWVSSGSVHSQLVLYPTVFTDTGLGSGTPLQDLPEDQTKRPQRGCLWSGVHVQGIGRERFKASGL